MSSRPELKLDWCSHEAAKYAVEHWHYSRCMPMPPVVKIGTWEDGRFIGCVLFSRGASPGLGSPYGLEQTQVAELTRVAFDSHKTPISRIVAIALRFLTKRCGGLRLVVSFADPGNGHHGGIYQAGNWFYTGTSKPELQFFRDGRWVHRREAVGKVTFGKANGNPDWRGLRSRWTPGKHRYLMPLDDEMRARIAPLAKSYPKRVGTIASDGPPVQGG
jgi:hypothetical protein